jgi:peptidoglycan hydrolase-like protein with peptidoglycan-binding domain
METRDLQAALNRLGFEAGTEDGIEGPRTRLATARFQLACNLPGHRLKVDGIPAPATWAALAEADRTQRLSSNFSVSELRSRVSPGGPKEGPAWVHRQLLEALEALRAHVGRPLSIISGYRSESHNKAVGGAKSSQHTYGTATDLQRVKGLPGGALLKAGRAADFNRGYIRLNDARNLRLFSGIGHRGGWVTHVDVRTAKTPASPSVWEYK